MTKVLPAVLIGGPPHMGKSVLSYALHRALRRRGVPHYLYRACPDGEGDWFHEGPGDVVRAIRVKGKFSQGYADNISRDLRERLLPLLVDVGGRPGSLDEPIFRACTHALLLTDTAEAAEYWRGLVAQADLHLLADLRSDLRGQTAIEATGPVIRGTIAGLERQQLVANQVIDLLVEQLAALLSSVPEPALRSLHLDRAPAGQVLELDRLCHTDQASEPGRWQPGHLPELLQDLADLPPASAFSLYGIAPNWVYGAVAAATQPVPLVQFDVRLGWVTPPKISLSQIAINDGSVEELSWRLHAAGDASALELQGNLSYLDYRQINTTLPAVPPERGLICSGLLPLWVWTALARAYQSLAWLAFYQPTLGQAVVVAARERHHKIGDRVPFTPTQPQNRPQN
jgi:CRISPR-associated protein Csx3